LLNIKLKLALALTAYAVLAFLVWQTLSNEPIRIFAFEVRLRTATLVVLSLFVFKTLLYFWRVKLEEADEKRRGVPE
jgi:hypothetical protein